MAEQALEIEVLIEDLRKRAGTWRAVEQVSLCSKEYLHAARRLQALISPKKLRGIVLGSAKLQDRSNEAGLVEIAQQWLSALRQVEPHVKGKNLHPDYDSLNTRNAILKWLSGSLKTDPERDFWSKTCRRTQRDVDASVKEFCRRVENFSIWISFCEHGEKIRYLASHLLDYLRDLRLHVTNPPHLFIAVDYSDPGFAVDAAPKIKGMLTAGGIQLSAWKEYRPMFSESKPHGTARFQDQWCFAGPDEADLLAFSVDRVRAAGSPPPAPTRADILRTSLVLPRSYPEAALLMRSLGAIHTMRAGWHLASDGGETTSHTSPAPSGGTARKWVSAIDETLNDQP